MSLVIRPALAVATGALVLVAGCGGSGNGSNAAASATSAPTSAASSMLPSAPPTPSASGPNAQICAKLRSDAMKLQSSASSATNPKQLASSLKHIASTFNADVKNANDATLRSGVHKAASALDAIANSVSNGQKISLSGLQAKLKSAAADLHAACPES